MIIHSDMIFTLVLAFIVLVSAVVFIGQYVNGLRERQVMDARMRRLHVWKRTLDREGAKQ